MRSYARRTDANHAEFLKTLAKFQVPYRDLSAVGKGCPDILALIKGTWCLIEVKDGKKPPSARELTPDQEDFHKYVQAKGGKIFVLKDVKELYELLGARWAA